MTASQAPFFVVGAHRSGTTMLRLMLNSHPRLAVPFESRFLDPWKTITEYGDLQERRNAERLLAVLGDDPWTKRGKVIQDPDAILAEPIATYGDLLTAVFHHYAERRGKARWGVKTPGYVTQLDQIWRIFPGCKVVHLVRDGRDVALSYRNLSWGPAHTPKAAEDWRWKVMLGHKMGGMIGDHYLEVHYEDLVRSSEATLRRICAFLGEQYDARMLEYHLDAEDEMPSDSIQWHRASTSAPDEGKVFAWKREMSVADQVLFDEIAGDALQQFGYERVFHSARLRVACKRVYYYVIKRL